MDGPCLTPVPMYWNQSIYLIIIHMDRLMGLIGSSLKRAFCLTLTFSLWLLQWPCCPTGIITLSVKLISLSLPHDGSPALLIPVLFHLFFFTKEIVLYLCYHYPHSLITITLLCVLIHTYYISHPHHNCGPYISCLLFSPLVNTKNYNGYTPTAVLYHSPSNFYSLKFKEKCVYTNQT